MLFTEYTLGEAERFARDELKRVSETLALDAIKIALMSKGISHKQYIITPYAVTLYKPSLFSKYGNFLGAIHFGDVKQMISYPYGTLKPLLETTIELPHRVLDVVNNELSIDKSSQFYVTDIVSEKLTKAHIFNNSSIQYELVQDILMDLVKENVLYLYECKLYKKVGDMQYLELASWTRGKAEGAGYGTPKIKDRS